MCAQPQKFSSVHHCDGALTFTGLFVFGSSSLLPRTIDSCGTAGDILRGESGYPGLFSAAEAGEVTTGQGVILTA